MITIPAQTPFFNPVLDPSNKVSMELAWQQYVDRVLIDPEDDSYPEVSLALYKYNMDNLPPDVEIKTATAWLDVIKSLSVNRKFEELSGQYMRIIYDYHGGSKPLKGALMNQLLTSTGQIQVNFLCAKQDDLTVFDLFKGSDFQILDALNDMATATSINDPRIHYLMQNIYKAKHLGDGNYDASHASLLMTLDKSFDSFIAHFQVDNTSILENMLCILHINRAWDRLYATVINQEPVCSKTENWIKSNYPEVYAKYKLLKEFDLKLSEIHVQLLGNLEVDAEPLPMGFE